MATPLKILIVEDSEDDAELILHILRRGGFDPDHVRVETAEQMLSAFDSAAWDVVICDHALPRLDAFAALKIARERSDDIPFIVVSGEIGEETAVESMRAGANDYVMKDSLKRLVPAIERELIETGIRRRQRQMEAELEENQNRLRHAQKLEALGLLTGGVAHDFNNLLTVIMGNLELLQDMSMQDDARKLIGQALSAATSGAGLTQRLLSFSRNQALSPEPTDINAIIPDICALIRSAVGAKIEINLSLADNLEQALVDRSGLESALLNLAINARDAMPDGGRLTITTEVCVFGGPGHAVPPGFEAGHFIAISVEDNGTGIPADVVDHVFDPFFTTKGAGEGSGLGLSMVFGFIKQSAGHIDLDSEFGRGTKITLYLPCLNAPAEVAETQQAPAETMTSGSEAILVLEDNLSIQLLINRTLTKLGYSVINAGYGRSALDVLKKTPNINMLLSDISLPGDMDGLEFVDQALQKRPDIRYLFISGNPDNADFSKNGRFDVSQVLKKPFRKRELSERVRAILDSVAE